VTNDEDVATAIGEAAKMLGRCDIVVANAGVRQIRTGRRARRKTGPRDHRDQPDRRDSHG
jgi:NAD(P)-dependent dehydrogenase (short-subunit alcohol dehydrogenase family)